VRKDIDRAAVREMMIANGVHRSSGSWFRSTSRPPARDGKCGSSIDKVPYA